MTFESLLVKELQKQQSRAEFCDIVLQAQGVSVPVHSCVLSAFSPWLCGTLSSMPSPRNGHKRLIEIQAIEVDTLLSLVTLLYSGQLNEDKDGILSAACKLGISVPQQGSKSQNNKAEKECQTEVHLAASLTLPSETIETVNVTGLSSWRSDQVLGSYASDITLTTLQNVQGMPEKFPAFQVMNVVPETSVYPTASAPQHYGFPPAPHPSLTTCAVPLANQDQSVLAGASQGQEYDLEQFENNIPGFISYFLNENGSQGAAQSQRGKSGDIKTKGRPWQARVRGDREGWKVRKTTQLMRRFGRVAQSVGIGRGGGRVGRMLDTRQHQGRKNRRQGSGAIYKAEGPRDRSSSRARPRKRQAEKSVDPACQDKPPPVKRSRGRPRKNAPTKAEIIPPLQKTTTAPFMMHTAPLPPSNQTDIAQPMDWLIDDVIAQLPFTPPIQHNQDEIMNTGTLDSHPETQASVKLVAQPQPEGELTDILDSFLRTFEQNIGACESDVRDGMPDGSRSNVTDARPESAQHETVQIDRRNKTSDYPFKTSSINKTTPRGPRTSQDRSRVSNCIPKKTFSCRVPGMSENNKRVKSETCRMTRSQSRNRELEKKKRRKMRQNKKQELINQEENEKKMQMHSEASSTIDSKFNVTSALRNVMTLPSACRVKCCTQNEEKTLDLSRSSENPGPVKKKRDRTKKLLKGGVEQSSRSDKSVTNTFTGTHHETSLCAFELIQNLLENRKKREEKEWKDKHERWKNKPRCAERTQSNRIKSPRRGLAEGRGERPIKNSNNKEEFNTDLVSTFSSTFSESPYSSRAMVSSAENIPSMPCTSHAIDTDESLETGHTQCNADVSEEDVDVLEVSSSLSESSAVVPIIADVIPSTDEEEEEEEEEDVVIEVLDSD